MLTISYDGLDFIGWQIQKKGVSIQQQIEKALKIALKEDIKIKGSGRTDAKAHALAQTASFQINSEIDIKKVLYSLNGLLPKTIRILSIEKRDLNFDARYSSKAKTYHYFVNTQNIQSPFTKGYCYHLRKKIDIDLLKKAATYFLGTHDFTSFTNKGSFIKNHVRTIYKLDIEIDNKMVILKFTANGFLYKMVRNIVGVILDVATKKLSLEDISKIFEKKDRKAASPPAPAYGLFLSKVYYEENFSKNSKKELKRFTLSKSTL